MLSDMPGQQSVRDTGVIEPELTNLMFHYPRADMSHGAFPFTSPRPSRHGCLLRRGIVVRSPLWTLVLYFQFLLVAGRYGHDCSDLRKDFVGNQG